MQESSMNTSRQSEMLSASLEQQKQMCDEALGLVNTGVAMQSSGDHLNAERTLMKAVEIMEKALEISYPSQEEQSIAQRLNKKMWRYVKMIKSQRNKSQNLSSTSRLAQKSNIIEMDDPPEIYRPILHQMENAESYGNIFTYLQNKFGFQENNILNQKEHLVLLITNEIYQMKEQKLNTPNDTKGPELELNLLRNTINKFHIRLFSNYTKWCKYLSQKPNFTQSQLFNITLFFLIWGEAGNLRQCPELLCFLLHKMLAMSSNSQTNQSLPSGDFLNRVIRPMYDEIQKDSDKKTSKGARAAHDIIRNYDDFNEFFWKKKCLRFDVYNIGPSAFSASDKYGNPKIVKKSFYERRSWITALISFRRVFFFSCSLFMATVGFAINMAVTCPDAPLMYGPDIKEGLSVFGHEYVRKIRGVERFETDLDEDDQCNLPKLATCLGVESLNKNTFFYVPEDFKRVLVDVPFTECQTLSSGRCECYLSLLEKCFSEKGSAEQFIEEDNEYQVINFNQKSCITLWRTATNNIIRQKGPGKLNCDQCQLTFKGIINNAGSLGNLLQTFLGDIKPEEPMRVYIFYLGGAFVAIVLALEVQNRFFSIIRIGFTGRSLYVPIGAYCRYVCFWLFLFIIKLTFDYQFMIKSLVDTTIFIWAAPQEEYLKYTNFMVQQSYHNIIYILTLWIPSWLVFIYDPQIFYAILSVVFGSIKGFNLKIGEVRSFRILRLTFKLIPSMFNRKMVSNLIDQSMNKKKKGKQKKNDLSIPVRRFERISYSEGSKPLTVKSQKYSSLLDHQSHATDYIEVGTPSGSLVHENGINDKNTSQLSSLTGVSGPEFERTIPFAMAWNRCLMSLRKSDVISDRELNVLSYLIDSKDTNNRRLYPPAFLTAGKLDESIDIIGECSSLYERLKTDKKKKDKSLQKIETAMRERLLKDDLRIEAILGSYKFSSQVLRLLLGEQHQELNEVFRFMEEMVMNKQILKALSLTNLYQCRAACADLMKAILEVPRTVAESSIKFQRSLYHVIDNVENVMNSLKQIVIKQEHLSELLNNTPLKPNSFFFPGDAQHYASSQLNKVLQDQACLDIVSRAYQLLTVDNFDAEPRSEEGRRRLRFFINSLFMDMPSSSPVRQMHSFSISTPYYNEIVLYSLKDLVTQNDDCIRLLFYLQTIYPYEWENFLERHQVRDTAEALKKQPEEVRLWASYRGQTLARTVRGMMYNEEAIRFLHWLEIGENEPMHMEGCNCNRCKKLDEIVSLKFNYVCTCQIYGKQKDEQRQQAHDIDYLLFKHPNLRVAYVDGPKKVKDGPPKYFSVLIRSFQSKIVEVYRIELPGNPILGEGKPENQNHAIVFSRGEMLQCIDMNQDGYLEECLKMPNLLSTKDRHSSKHPLTIIGFREHVFTGGVSNLASFMSIQELSFVSLGQRMLGSFHVRQHYGHPDIFDKIFAMTTGGTAKASKGINLSEDIFAGFNHTLRGGYVSHEEFIQVGKGRDVGMQQLTIFEAKLSSGAGECVLSRDCMRMATRLDFFRLQSWFYGNLGWYFTQTLTVGAIYIFIYGKMYHALSGLDEYFLENGGLGIGSTLNTSWALQLGFLLVVPVIAVIGVEKGFRHGIAYLFWNILTLGPIFFTFQMGTRMHYFDRTLIHGGARYRATGRGFTIKHEKFAELFRFYAYSHFYRGVELAFLLILYTFYATLSWCNCSWRIDRDFYNDIEPNALDWKARCYANHFQQCVLPTNQNYGVITFSLWIIAATWMWGPFFFNPSGLDWDKVIEDYNDWQNWLQTNNDSSESWFGWWTTELEYLEHSSSGAKFIMFVRKCRFLFLAIGIYLNMCYRLTYGSRNEEIPNDSIVPYIIVGIFFVFIILFLCCGYMVSRWVKRMANKQRKLRKVKFHVSFVVLVIIIILLSTVMSLYNIIECGIIMLLLVFWFLQYTIVQLHHHHMVVRSLARGFDRVVGWFVFGPIVFVAMFLPFISAFQQRVMFNNAFTSGLEVSKLLSHESAVPPQTSLSSKDKSKKKKKVKE